jgi:hypothetical protein
MEGIVVLHETIHGLHPKKNGVILKLDFEKAYFFATGVAHEGLFT